MTIEQRQQEIVAEFADIEDWMDRYGYIIDLGNALPPLPDELKTPCLRCPTSSRHPTASSKAAKAAYGSTPTSTGKGACTSGPIPTP